MSKDTSPTYPGIKYQRALLVLIILIGVLAAFAAGMGLFYDTPGQPYDYTTLRGEQVQINAHGLYFYDTVSSAAQMQANDLITLALGLPLLALSSVLALRGSLRGRLLLTGTLGFFLYTYLSMATNAAFNALFLVYVALFALSLYAFILAMMGFDLRSLPAQFSARLPRKWIAGLLFVMAGFLLLAWLGRVTTPLLQGTPPAMENGMTMVIQFMDLALIVPFAVLAGVLLLRGSAWGYLLASVAVMKMLTMGTAVSTMGINMALRGVPDSTPMIVVFILLTLVNAGMGYVLLKNVRSAERAEPAE